MIGADTTFLIELDLLEHPRHRIAHQILHREVLSGRAPLVLTPQVLSEFVHITTDPRRFALPLTIEVALDRAMFWWNAVEVQHAFPSDESTRLFLEWMKAHRLGRKRLLDTQLPLPMPQQACCGSPRATPEISRPSGVSKSSMPEHSMPDEVRAVR